MSRETICYRCHKAVDSTQDLSRCQSTKHRHLRDAFCTDCLKQHGTSFYSPFYCLDCHPDEKPPKKERNRTEDASNDKTRAKGRTPKKTRHARLITLRKALGFLQPEMAAFLGISARQYQDWEYDESCMPRTAKILCWHIAHHYRCIMRDKTSDDRLDLCVDWPEGCPISVLGSDEFKAATKEGETCE